MPFRPEHSLLRVEVPALHTIDTSSVENLFGMWSLFSKTSHAMEDGKRLENLSWRLWNRETFCCAPRSSASATSRSAPSQRRSCQHSATTGGNIAMPPLSSSLESASSSSDGEIDTRTTSSTTIPKARPEIRRHDSTDSSRSRGREKHITPIDLEKIVISIKETQDLEPIDLELPSTAPSSQVLEPLSTSPSEGLSMLHITTSNTQDAPQSTTSHASASHNTLLESSASTVATDGSQASQTSQTVGSQDSSSTEMSTHSIVRGFVPGGAPSSYRSQTNLATTQPTPILKTSPQYRMAPPKSKKGPMFTIGTSSDEGESSLESHMHRSQLSESLKRGGSLLSDRNRTKKTTSFQEEVAVARESPVFESDDEDEEVSESAIEDDDDSSDWEDSDDQSGPSSVNDNALFQRVDSRPDLTSRRSLLTTLMHEPDRAKALANAASRSQPHIRRSRTTTPNGPSVATSPEPNSQIHMAGGKEHPRAKPIIMTTSNTHDQTPALSPRTTRRNMLSTELTESLRKNLLWERQHRSTGNLAALKRRHTSTDVKNLKQQPEPVNLPQTNGKSFTNDYFHQGLGEYHAKGW